MAKMDLNEDSAKESIETIFWSAMDLLSDDDKKLPQVRLLSIIIYAYFIIKFKIMIWTLDFGNHDLTINNSHASNLIFFTRN